jgi:fatty acid-binding protein DegV
VAAGRDVVSIHVAGGISGTVESARQAAADVAARSGRRIDVVDSQMGCGALGLVAWAAAVAAEEGADPDGVLARARQAIAATRLWFAVDTLNIKPILTLEGEITPVERVRTSGRAFERLVDYMSSRRSDGADGWVVQHIRADDGAARLVERGRALFGCEPLFVSEIGPVIGAHVGPGLLGVGGLPRALVGA